MQLPTVHQGWGGRARRGRAAPARARAGTGPSGSGASSSSATSSATQPRRNRLTSRSRVARRCRRGGRSTSASDNSVLVRDGVLHLAADPHQPERRHRHRQPQPAGPLRVGHARPLPLPAAALDQLEAVLDPGAQPVPAGIGGLRRQVGQHQPRVGAARPPSRPAGCSPAGWSRRPCRAPASAGPPSARTGGAGRSGPARPAGRSRPG